MKDNNQKRKVEVCEWKRVEGKTHYEKSFIGLGIFHCFGVSYEEFESGPGNYSTAIIEMNDGSVMNVAVDLIKFIN